MNENRYAAVCDYVKENYTFEKAADKLKKVFRNI